jgi:serine/threonine protein kinase
MGVSARISAQPVSGPRLPERYQLRRHIANGGMASVWCAEDRVLGRSVAVKVLAERYAGDQFAVQRFKREARAAARVSAHPHVVTIFDVGDLEPDEADGDDPYSSRGSGTEPPAFIVMEYLSGGTVADAIRVGAVRRPEAVRWLAEAASALDHAHQRGVVHRDIKPANFLLDNARSLYVADFGIARLQSEDTITSTGQLFGTAAYLAPEQAMGLEATSATDRYSLAVAAFELLAGERPFTATNFAAQARQHIDEEPPSASERLRALPPGVDPVLIRGMAKDPADRYETAGAFVAALEDALDARAPQTRALAPRRGLVAVGPRPTGPRPALGAGGRPPRSRPPRSRPRTARPPTSRPASQLTAPASTRPRGSGRMTALAALAVAALGVALVGLLGNSGSTAGHAASAASHTSRRGSTHHRARHAKATPATNPTVSTAAATTTASASSSTTSAQTPAGSAASLQQQGHQDLVNGNYAAAIAANRQALSASNPADLTYAYALYDLGDALMRSGNPQAAIPVLEQRLKIPNQTAVVQQTLDQARRAAGVTTPTASAQAGTPTPARDRGHGSGGRGLPPGQAKHNGGGGGNGGGD